MRPSKYCLAVTILITYLCCSISRASVTSSQEPLFRAIRTLRAREEAVVRASWETSGVNRRRSLLAAVERNTCVWLNASGSLANAGACDLNEYFILTLGSPPSDSARILAHLQYKSSVCSSYATQAACLAQPADACGWDRLGGGGCFLSASAAYDPELLLGRLYCPGSLLGAAAACALLAPRQQGAGGAAGSGSGSGAAADPCAAANPGCVSLSPARLASLGPAAVLYAALVAVVTYTASDDSVGSGGCAARWLTQPDTLAELGRGVLAAPAAGLLQPGLVGSCPEVARLSAAYAAAASNCSAPPRAAAADACAAGGGGGGGDGGDGVSCRWEEAAGGGGGGTCVVGDDVLYDILYDPNDPWVAAFKAAAAQCGAAASAAACEAAGGRIRVDPGRMAAFKDVLMHGGGAHMAAPGMGLGRLFVGGGGGGGGRGRVVWERLAWAALGAGGMAAAAGALWAVALPPP